ncbi:MAG: response regulator [Elusimicrobiota bacterium]|nr:response regulator [Elusimicrobiota bacterium]
MSKWILIVDDDPAILAVTEAAISHPQLRITTASDAIQAFIQARDLKPALVISDIQMPGGEYGPDALKKLRADPKNQSVPFVFVTGMPLDQAKALMPPGDPMIRLLTKPIDFEVLRKLVWGYCGIPLDGEAAPK